MNSGRPGTATGTMYLPETSKQALSRCCEAVEGACEPCSQWPVSMPVSMSVMLRAQRAAMTEIHRPHRFSDRLDADWQHTATARRTAACCRTAAACAGRHTYPYPYPDPYPYPELLGLPQSSAMLRHLYFVLLEKPFATLVSVPFCCIELASGVVDID